MEFSKVVAAVALVKPNFNVPTIWLPTVVPQVSVSGVESPPMLTTIGPPPAEKPPPLAVHWNVAPEVPRLRVKLTVPLALLCSTPPSSDKKEAAGMPPAPKSACNAPLLIVVAPL